MTLDDLDRQAEETELQRRIAEDQRAIRDAEGGSTNLWKWGAWFAVIALVVLAIFVALIKRKQNEDNPPDRLPVQTAYERVLRRVETPANFNTRGAGRTGFVEVTDNLHTDLERIEELLEQLQGDSDPPASPSGNSDGLRSPPSTRWWRSRHGSRATGGIKPAGCANSTRSWIGSPTT